MKMPGRYYGPEPILPTRAVAVLAGLNRDYLDLLLAGRLEGVELLGVRVMDELGAATPAVLDSIAACSYALFALEPSLALRAVDPAAPQVNDPVTERYGGSPRDGGAWTAFTTAALSFAWHLSRNSPIAARVMLGFQLLTADAMAAVDPWQLRYIAGQQPVPLKPRWGSNPCFWPDLVRCAMAQSALELDLARLLGLQLLAAEMQPGPRTAERRRRT